MAINQLLDDVVSIELYRQASIADPSLNIITEGDADLGRSVVRSMGNIAINEPHKIRRHFGNFIGYGYDFNESADGEPAKEIYDRAVETTKGMVNNQHVEHFVAEGVVNNRFGWYVTRFPS